MDLTITKATLDRYCIETGSYIEGDDDGTTMLSVGSVLIASIAGTRSPDVISTLTRLPVGFVAAVLIVSEAGAHESSSRFADLSLAVRNSTFDICDIEKVLADLLVEIVESLEPAGGRS
jgi:hypothetical protein